MGSFGTISLEFEKIQQSRKAVNLSGHQEARQYRKERGRAMAFELDQSVCSALELELRRADIVKRVEGQQLQKALN